MNFPRAAQLENCPMSKVLLSSNRHAHREAPRAAKIFLASAMGSFAHGKVGK